MSLTLPILIGVGVGIAIGIVPGTIPLVAIGFTNTRLFFDCSRHSEQRTTLVAVPLSHSKNRT